MAMEIGQRVKVKSWTPTVDGVATKATGDYEGTVTDVHEGGYHVKADDGTVTTPPADRCEAVAKKAEKPAEKVDAKPAHAAPKGKK